MTEKRVEFNSRLKDIFKDYDGPDNEPLTFEESRPEFDSEVMIMNRDPLKDHAVLCLVRYYWLLRGKKEQQFLLKFARFLYENPNF